MKYSDISKYRTELMGIAILWVYLFHSQIIISRSFYYCIPFVLKETGYIGVDIFFFLSGYGLIYLFYNNNTSISSFYYKRFLRIIPTYWIIILINSLLRYCCFGEISTTYNIIQKMLCTGFFTNKNKFDWFVPTIIFLYILYPIFYFFYKKAYNKNNIIYLIIFCSMILCILVILTNNNFFLISASRVPIFFIGSHIGYLSITNNAEMRISQIIKYLFLIATSALLLAVIIIKFNYEKRSLYGLWWYPLIVSTFPICLFFTSALKYFFKNAGIFSNLTKKILLYCGNNSLEIYLIHVFIVFPVGEKLFLFFRLMEWPINSGRVLEHLIYLFISIGLAISLRKCCKSIISVSYSTIALDKNK